MVIFLRHGATHPLSRETPDPGLNPHGQQAIKEQVQRLPKVTRILTDTTARTRESAADWAKRDGVTPEVDPRLNNWDLGPQHKGKHSAATDELVSQLVKHPDMKPNGGESMREYQTRLFAAVGPHIASHELVGIVNHSRGIKSVETAMKHPDAVVTPEHWKATGLVPKASAMRVTPEKTERLA